MSQILGRGGTWVTIRCPHPAPIRSRSALIEWPLVHRASLLPVISRAIIPRARAKSTDKKGGDAAGLVLLRQYDHHPPEISRALILLFPCLKEQLFDGMVGFHFALPVPPSLRMNGKTIASQPSVCESRPDLSMKLCSFISLNHALSCNRSPKSKFSCSIYDLVFNQIVKHYEISPVLRRSKSIFATFF